MIAYLDAPALVVDVMVSSVIAGQMLERVPGESVAAVIINCLDGRAREKPHSLSGSQARKFECYASSHGIEKEALEWVVVQGTKGIGDVESVMA